jgi:hypothetical protein
MSTDVKLNKQQRRTLRNLAKGGDYMMATATEFTECHELINAGLVRVFGPTNRDDYRHLRSVEITDEGRAWLAANKQGGERVTDHK